MVELYYAAVGWADNSWSEALRDSHAEAQAWLREQSARGEPVTTVLTPQRRRTESQPATQARLAALRHPETADWSGSLHAAHLLCAADYRASPELVARRLAELDVEARLVETALAARIVTTARAHGWSPSEALHLDLDDVRWHQHDPLEIPVPEDVAAEVHELRERARADPAWWASLWRHLNAILQRRPSCIATGAVETCTCRRCRSDPCTAVTFRLTRPVNEQLPSRTSPQLLRRRASQHPCDRRCQQHALRRCAALLC